MFTSQMFANSWKLEVAPPHSSVRGGGCGNRYQIRTCLEHYAGEKGTFLQIKKIFVLTNGGDWPTIHFSTYSGLALMSTLKYPSKSFYHIYYRNHKTME